MVSPLRVAGIKPDQSTLKLSMTCGQYDRTRPLIDGIVRPDGIELDVSSDDDHLARQQKIRDGFFDVCEFFTGTYIADLPFRRLGFTALPVFPHRMFRHSNIHLNRKAGIGKPSDLNGRRVGLRFWSITAGLWMKGILEDDHGVDLSSITWVVSLPAGIPDWRPPSWLKLESAPAGMTEYELLVSGNTAAAVTADWWKPGKHPDIGYLFPDYEEEERDFYNRTRCVPIMHTLTVRTSILEKEPWVASSLIDAFNRSRLLGQTNAVSADGLHAPPPARPGTPLINAYGFKAARHELDRLLGYAHRQGVIPRKYQPEEMFWPATLGT
jgi:4,5-dihydroxyphthalate decarboxylase